MLALGTELPRFTLPDVRTGNAVSTEDFEGTPVLIMFICNHCPYVKLIQAGLAELGRDYQGRRLAILGVAPNDASSHPEDRPEELAAKANALGFTFPVLYDESQNVARALTAACTPDFFLFDSQHRLAYRGQFDDARPQNGLPVTGESLRTALEQVLAESDVPADQRPSMGCSIKWKAEPLSIS